MQTYKIEAMLGRKVISSTSVVAASHVHAVVKAVARPLTPGSTPAKPRIRVTEIETRTVKMFQFAH